MPPIIVTAAIIFLVSTDVSRRLMSRAVAALSAEQKAIVAEPQTAMSKRGWFFTALGAFVGVLVMRGAAQFRHFDWLMAGFFILAIALTIRGVVLRFRRLSSLRLPPAYVRRARLSVAILALGVTLMLGAALYGTFTLAPL